MQTPVSAIWQNYYQEKSPQIRDQILVKYLGLVHYVVNKIFKSLPQDVDRNDLINIGVIGLSEAADRYNPYMGIKFETYAIPRIRGAIIDELRKQDWVPRSLRTKANKIKKVMEMLEQTHPEGISDQTVASYLGISEKDYRRWQLQLARNGLISLDKPNHLYDDHNLYESIPSTSSDSPVHDILEEEMKQILNKVIKKLPEKARMAITLYYFEKLTFKEIGKILSVSESRISQIHSETIIQMKRLMKRELAA